MRSPNNSTSTCGCDVTEDSPAGAPGPINPETGQHTCYYILKPEERSKGFIRPVRDAYKHVGVRPKYPTRPLTEDEHKSFNEWKGVPTTWENYVEREEYPDGRVFLWTQSRLSSGCGAVTTMSNDIAETWARDISYYGSTFCTRCKKHFPVEEFRWYEYDGTVSEVLGT